MTQPSLSEQIHESRSLLAEHSRAARQRQAETLRKLEGHSNSLIRRADVREAVLVRGSLARGDFCSHSDIDLIVLTEFESESVGFKHLDSLVHSMGRRLSIDCWNKGIHKTRSLSIAFWLAVLGCRFVGGDEAFFLQSRRTWLKAFVAMPISALFELRRLDMRRNWEVTERLSPVGMNIKRARGGLVDADFMDLLRIHCVRNLYSSRENEAEFSASRIIRDELFLVKSLLHDITGGPSESALLDSDGLQLPFVLNPNRVGSLMDCLMSLVNVLSVKLQCG